MPASLPIDPLLPDMIGVLRRGRSLVVVAEPGAGKTTRVPPALLAAGLAGDAEIIVAQPRRIAARMAASRVASELGEPVGQRCGYQVRFDRAVSAATRIRFVTEGLLARRLRDDPQLRGVGIVVLDEIHERHIDTDLCLALTRRLQRGPRPDLRLVAMSATVDAGPLAEFLGAEAIHCPGRTFPVTHEHEVSDKPLPTQVANVVRRLADEGLDGSVLVFLPGAAEIRKTAAACAAIARSHDLEVVALHGDLPAEQQDRAVTPGKRPKIILSTNVAETSVTIDGVVVVIDSGLARRPSHDPFSGVPTLTLAKISQASATQRAGRAGRTRPGRCVRLYAAHDLARRPKHEVAELQRLDLAGAMLDLRAAGLNSVNALAWLQTPPEAGVVAADALLRELGAIDGAGAPTPIGTAMMRYPTHPRLARLLVESKARGVPTVGAGAAAVLSERSIHARGGLRGASQRGAPADVLADLAQMDAARRDPAIANRLDRGATRAVARVRKQLLRLLGGARDTAERAEDALCIALLLGYPDRVARAQRRPGQPDRLVFAAGGDAELSPDSVVHGADLVVALAVEQRTNAGRTKTLVRSAAHIEPEWLVELPGDRLVETTVVTFDAKRQRVQAERQTRYGELLIDATPCEPPADRAAATLRQAAVAAGPAAFVRDTEALDALLARAAFVAKHRPELEVPSLATAHALLARMCQDATSFADLRRADLLAQLTHGMDPASTAAFARLAPSHVVLAGGRRLKVQYEADRDPWVGSRLQDFFGASTGPSVLEGTLPVVVHLLAPNQRAVQVTTDLAGFWARHYPELRKALMRRYPRHAWPEDPQNAKPPAPRPPRRRRT